ncbi:hypothetical protein [Pedobacter metabolipauper]|uniref:Oligosaccharide repeat unit polymerase n=1 Tax=Pedobacter metabolipauper TaxID=425513 RepID=A0A4R6SVQ6_9SPHI|nr:hypothetical protein [Pedobacter metabolipauper]TDQ09968.1 hypothetical protein ATK78_2127 [Pedobacter metabolipauper]
MDKRRIVIDCNPFFIYVVCFSVPILLYLLDWSYLYPKLSASLIGFLGVTFLISIVIGVYVNRKRALRYMGTVKKLNLINILIAITIGNIMNFIYEGQIPLFAIINLVTIEKYGSFGLPTFGVLISTLGSFMTSYFFYYYIVTRDKKYLFASLYLFIFPILIFSRGTVLLNLSTMLFVYLFSIKTNRLKVYARLGVFLVLLLLVFGYAGNLRSNNQMSKEDSSTARKIMLELGQAKPAFTNTAIPPEFFWSYIYMSSPLANLQYNINTYRVEYNFKSAFRYFNYEIIFDSISKRIGELFEIKRPFNNLIAPYLTVGTIYSGAYTDLGWLGMTLTFCSLMLIAFIYVAVIKPSNPYYTVGLAVLNTIMLFNLFDNMISFTPLSFQLLYPFIFSLKFGKNITS